LTIFQKYQELCDDFAPQHSAGSPAVHPASDRPSLVTPADNRKLLEGQLSEIAESVKSAADRYGIADETSGKLHLKLEHACELDRTQCLSEQNLSDWLEESGRLLSELSTCKREDVVIIFSI